MIAVPARERHRIGRMGWLRAAVLGANDGILSTASLVLGVATSHTSHNNIVVAGLAELVAGAMSMAAGEYVSVHSQADTERAELKLERAELKADDSGEHAELAAIYVSQGLDPTLAKQVAGQLMARDALGAHARDELGISATFTARPVQAALASRLSLVDAWRKLTLGFPGKLYLTATPEQVDLAHGTKDVLGYSNGPWSWGRHLRAAVVGGGRKYPNFHLQLVAGESKGLVSVDRAFNVSTPAPSFDPDHAGVSL